MCPVTRTVFKGNVEAAVLRPTCVVGWVLSEDRCLTETDAGDGL